MKVKSESEVVQSCPTLSDPVDCGPPGSSSMGFSRQVLEWVAILRDDNLYMILILITFQDRYCNLHFTNEAKD